MIICRTQSEWKKEQQVLQDQPGTFALVPTMGALHEGHLTLIREAKQHHARVVVTIFINLYNLGLNEDFDSYPRTEDQDLKLLQREGADVVWLPGVQDLYKEKQMITMNTSPLGDQLCGSKRVGHFDGMATVVMKFLQLVAPDAAYFGKKDAQQLAIIKKMVQDFHIQTTIVGVNTVRDDDGLALSSRNVHLNERERIDAPILYKALMSGVNETAHTSNAQLITKKAIDQLEGSLASIEYVELVTFPNLETVHSLEEGNRYLLAAAVQYERARLIDNIIFTMS
ncbi:LOW QUALITY PROTEIN: pantoate-beta-alanine ligase [Geomicrobium sp. JCM 19038]|nr:LOW QUALITY PROTEIN: pantoate-beta-alanine ligase [Geomicrobium sp. JCM 19038]